jgi:hypothetical protein
MLTYIALLLLKVEKNHLLHSSAFSEARENALVNRTCKCSLNSVSDSQQLGVPSVQPLERRGQSTTAAKPGTTSASTSATAATSARRPAHPSARPRHYAGTQQQLLGRKSAVDESDCLRRHFWFRRRRR